MEGTIGEIRMFAGTFAPRTWAFCNSQLLSIASNTALFSILGTTYGGNGQTNFALPDFQGRMPVGTGTGPGLPNIQLGQKAGSPTVTLLSSNMPAHNHAVTGTVAMQANNDATGLTDDATGARTGLPASPNIYTQATDALVAMAPAQINLNTALTGNSQPFSIVPPYLGMNFIICMFGIFPARN